MKRIIFLDWLRIFSFSSVLIGHKFHSILLNISNDDSVHESSRFLIKLILPLAYAGGAGVVVFFLVSGYVISHVLQTEQPLEFLIKRIFRIYPLYIFAVLFQYSLLYFVNPAALNLKIIIQQLLLVGDFFQTPCTLGGVEWTLRVEVLFYLFMFVLRYFKIIGQHRYALPWVLIITTLALGYIPAFPSGALAVGYLNIYGPFLFLGVFFWLYENKQVSFAQMAVFTGFIFIQHWHLIDTISPYWRHDHFAALAFLIFLAVWTLRDKLFFNRVILFISELTYSVYLLHNWLFDHIKQWTIAGGLFHQNRYALMMLLAISAVLVKAIEKPGIKLGRLLIQHLKTPAPNYPTGAEEALVNVKY
ncbi:acyltransferase family protein [Legionella drozanskii]|uniref:Acyltransferase n=1 Tax=Legionella drozanskii LLAP-1 TaxID=1212489 RepID=A0A0W0SQ63_9GAMM|nr:acyltransferase [Legionella drozanskii]KTC85483.1 acyltransferase [Legionella drozanskii LLAP-1]